MKREPEHFETLHKSSTFDCFFRSVVTVLLIVIAVELLSIAFDAHDIFQSICKWIQLHP